MKVVERPLTLNILGIAIGSNWNVLIVQHLWPKNCSRNIFSGQLDSSSFGFDVSAFHFNWLKTNDNDWHHSFTIIQVHVFSNQWTSYFWIIKFNLIWSKTVQKYPDNNIPWYPELSDHFVNKENACWNYDYWSVK